MTKETLVKALVFDIGGVCVLSPLRAILNYEIENDIPLGWVNFAISHTSPTGSWHRLERGEIQLDADFFSAFNKDLRHTTLWKQFCEQRRAVQTPSRIHETLPPAPEIDGEKLFWKMMHISRTPDPFMFPALKKLRDSGQFVMGALSNTVIFPDGHLYNEDAIGLKAQFDFFISSAHTGLRKPDPRIYRLALKRIGEVAKSRGIDTPSASDVLFIDDIGENLKGAKSVGMKTLKVALGRTRDAVEELERITGLQLHNGDRSKL